MSPFSFSRCCCSCLCSFSLGKMILEVLLRGEGRPWANHIYAEPDLEPADLSTAQEALGLTATDALRTKGVPEVGHRIVM